MFKRRTTLIFVIKDNNGEGAGIAPSMVQARRQIAWFLSKKLTYTIEPCVIPVDPPQPKETEVATT